MDTRHDTPIEMYVHPDGPAIDFDTRAFELIAWNGFDSIRIPIGPLGLADLGAALIAMGKAMQEGK